MGNAPVRTVLLVLSAVAVIAAGLLHLSIWNGDYREIPGGALPGLWVVKIGFPVQAAVSVVLAAALLLLRRPIVWMVALLVEIGSVGALVLSRQASLFGWKEPDWSGDAKTVLIVELVAAALLAVLVVLDYRSSESWSPATASQK